ncbi:ABC transporter substrate-binding protein [Allosalinactinospora lopnorensis]|uniref:ABC transporter substrate-binding protein n=1 Tax=Allosalinactinospora lopnorensis TaxID=1352348 RepID=UPI000623F66E|nr:extracellular solute-binding protein [Allosalinactinospora lopnorensis]
MKSNRVRLALAVAVTAVIAAGCGTTQAEDGAAVSGSWKDVVAAAKEEGSVTVYSSQHPRNLEPLKKAFQTEYPEITVEFVRGVDADLGPKVEAEKQTGRSTADVYVTAAQQWITDVAEPGDFAVDVQGPHFDTPDYNQAQTVDNGKYFLVSAAVLGLGWNTELLPEGLEGYDDLLNPELEGKIGITKPTSGAYVDFYNFVTEQAGDDFLPQLAELDPRVYPSTLPITQALTSGELAATLVVQPLVPEQEDGAPVDWTLPDPVWGAPWKAMVLSAAPHPNAAQLMADFMVSHEGQVAQGKDYASVLPVEGAVADAQEIPDLEARLQTTDAVAAYQKEWEAMFE